MSVLYRYVQQEQHDVWHPEKSKLELLKEPRVPDGTSGSWRLTKRESEGWSFALQRNYGAKTDQGGGAELFPYESRDPRESLQLPALCCLMNFQQLMQKYLLFLIPGGNPSQI